MTVNLHPDAIRALFADKEGPVGRIMEAKAIEIENVAKALLLLPAAGETYMPGVMTFKHGGKIYSNWSTGGRVAKHTASLAGEPPASDTGSLLSSISHEMKVEETVYAVIGTPLKYGLYLEKGTQWHDDEPGEHIAPRPWLVPALHIVVPE